ncbi:hypothetical protein JTE90_018395 [Oedothorax gibbosus]|uniref:G-protein coupled receptors family 1 profile domain-containing protein n=1 Tax=Oedothorax gibbosus TaxID=931172 RepID=A0AAV6TUS6_9ARAC|nr:hypothetical protein JTE90_018395 [Oedothorax gibbosus]
MPSENFDTELSVQYLAHLSSPKALKNVMNHQQHFGIFHHRKQNLFYDGNTFKVRIRSPIKSLRMESEEPHYSSKTSPEILRSETINPKIPEQSKNESSVKQHSSKNLQNMDIDDFFSPQMPLPSEEHFLVIPSNDSYQNCSINGTTEQCGLEHAPVSVHSTLVKAVILLVMAGLSMVGNIATLYSIIKTGRQSASTVYILLVQLAVADLLVAVFCLMADAIWSITVQWYGGNALCKFFKFMQMFSLYLSTYVLVLIGFDRLCAIRFPMARLRAKFYVRNGIVLIWSLSAIFSSPQAVVFSVLRGPFVEEFHQCVTYGFYTAAWQEQLYTSLSLVLMFLVPLATLLVTYVTTFVTIASQENMFSDRSRRSALEDARHRILQKAKKCLKHVLFY